MIWRPSADRVSRSRCHEVVWSWPHSPAKVPACAKTEEQGVFWFFSFLFRSSSWVESGFSMSRLFAKFQERSSCSVYLLLLLLLVLLLLLNYSSSFDIAFFVRCCPSCVRFSHAKKSRGGNRARDPSHFLGGGVGVIKRIIHTPDLRERNC